MRTIADSAINSGPVLQEIVLTLQSKADDYIVLLNATAVLTVTSHLILCRVVTQNFFSTCIAVYWSLKPLTGWETFQISNLAVERNAKHTYAAINQ